MESSSLRLKANQYTHAQKAGFLKDIDKWTEIYAREEFNGERNALVYLFGKRDWICPILLFTLLLSILHFSFFVIMDYYYYYTFFPFYNCWNFISFIPLIQRDNLYLFSYCGIITQSLFPRKWHIQILDTLYLFGSAIWQTLILAISTCRYPEVTEFWCEIFIV